MFRALVNVPLVTLKSGVFRSTRPGLLALTTVFLLGSGPAIAKCATSELIFRSAAIAGTLVVAGPDGAARFNIWNGPLVRMNNQPIHTDPAHTRGHFVDWARGPLAAAPDVTQSFRVSFHCRIDDDEGPREMYSVDYAFKRDSIGGFIYLPGRDDPKYALNVSTISHGTEGSWYHSTDAWENVIRPILEQALGN